MQERLTVLSLQVVAMEVPLAAVALVAMEAAVAVVKEVVTKAVAEPRAEVTLGMVVGVSARSMLTTGQGRI